MIKLIYSQALQQKRPPAQEGGATPILKLRQIEPEFLDRMFSTEVV